MGGEGGGGMGRGEGLISILEYANNAINSLPFLITRIITEGIKKRFYVTILYLQTVRLVTMVLTVA